MSLSYYKRLYETYIKGEKSHLDFWHGTPMINPAFEKDTLGQYYMLFYSKAKYDGYFDENGVPLLNYRGDIGLQHNPIAIAQYGLGNYNLYCKMGEEKYKRAAILQADWLVENLTQNSKGLWVWMHNFDWKYIETLKAPWYSGLAQGQGISLLARVYELIGNELYLETLKKAFIPLTVDVSQGGAVFVDEKGQKWIEEYMVTPPSHILNGFLWALFGVYDYYLLIENSEIKDLFYSFVETIRNNLPRYDIGFWSLYDLSDNNYKNIASPFYHQLHIVQLRILAKLSGIEEFERWADKWESYRRKMIYRTRALFQKGLFKLRRF